MSFFLKYIIFNCFLLFLFLGYSTVAVGQVDSNSKECVSFTVEKNQVLFRTKDNAALSLLFCSPSVIRVWFDPKATFKRSNPSFAVVDESLETIDKIDVNEQASCYEIHTATLRIRLNKKPMQLQIFDKWQKLIFSDYSGEGYISEGSAIRTTKMLRSDEQFFGLGEKAGTLNRRGNSYKMWNSDKPCYSVNEDPLYKSIPFFMSSYRYGIFLDNTYKTKFDFGVNSSDHYSFEAPNGNFIYYFFSGKDYKEILSQYIKLTGKPIMPPKWAFGFAQSRGMYTKEAQALEIAQTFRDKKIPCDIIYQDIGWTQFLQDFNWRKGNYNNPKNMLQTLQQQGFKMIVSQDPVVSQENKPQWSEADKLGYFVTDTRTGKPYDMPWPWGGNCGVIDFTKPAVADWWGKLQQKPIDDGVKGFWTDMGEPAWSNEEDIDRLNMKHNAGMHDEIHNVYGLTWDKVVKEQFEKHNPDKRIFQMTRAGYAGMQRYTFGWSGDSGNGQDILQGWGQLQNQLVMGVSAGLGGIPFWTTDISGYCGDITDYRATAELYTRWMQFGIFNPLSRAHHEGDNAVEPWLFGAEAEKNVKAAIELKYKLFPYIYTYARQAHDTGVPLMRGLFMEFPSDMEAVQNENQFMFGEALLVAPVMKKGARTKDVYLPEGEWIDFNDKKTVYTGNQQITYKAPLNVIPIFVKKGSIIPQMPVMQYIHEKNEYPLLIDLFPASEEETASFELYEDDGETLDYLKGICGKTRFECTTTNSEYTTIITAEDNGFRQSKSRNIVLRYYIHDMPASVVVDGKPILKFGFELLDKKTNTLQSKAGWAWNKDKNECIIIVPDNRKKIEISIKKIKNNKQ